MFKDLIKKITSLFKKKSPLDSIQPISQKFQESSTKIITSVSQITGQISQMAFPSRTSEKIKSKNWIPYVVVTLLALMTADLVAIKSRLYMIPAGAPNAKKINIEQSSFKPRTLYDEILARNIFNSDGVIPELMVAGTAGNVDVGPARESSLDLTLVGTIVHANPGKSVATIEFKNNPDKVLPYIPNDDIEGLATVMKVERKRVYIRNLSSGAMEYIQIKDEPGITFNKKVGAKQDGPVAQEGDNTFGISRMDLETQMQNLPDLLTQAKAVPNIVGGRVDGYKITEITPNALFRKFGIGDGDVIKEVDGEKLDSPAKAMELYNGLRTKNQIRMTVEKNGKTTTMTYNIR